MLKASLPLLAALTTACASTGAVPRPFPGAPIGKSSPASPLSPTAPAPDDPAGPASAGSPGNTRDTVNSGNPDSIDDYALVGTALSLRGTPYRNGGSDPNGFDCSGFTQYVFARYGVALPRAVREQFLLGKPVDTTELSPGDLLFFATTEPGASHVGILVGGDAFIHAPSSTGVVRVEHLTASYWSQRFLGARRVE